MTEPVEPDPSALDGVAPLMQCDDSPASGLDGVAPLMQCDDTPATGLDGGSPLFLCNERPAAGLDGPSALLQCDGSPPEPPPPPPGSGSSRPGLVPALIGVGTLLIAGGLYVGGVFDGGSPAPAALKQPITGTVAPSTSGVPTPTRTPGATVSPTRSPGQVQSSAPSVVISGTRSPLPRPVPVGSPQPTPSLHPSPTAPAPTATKPAVSPTVGKIGTKPSTIEEANKKGSCGGSTTSTVTVTVTDPAAIASVTLVWTTGSHGSGSMSMAASGGSTYAASFGNFPADSAASDDTISLTVKAKDSGGRTGSNSTTMTLSNC